MNRDRTKNLPLPAPDQIARALMMRKQRDAAVAFLEAVMIREPENGPCAALLEAIRARPRDSVQGPDIELSFRLVTACVRRGWIAEATALLSAGIGAEDSAAEQLQRQLSEVLQPVPAAAEAEFAQLPALVRHGSGAIALEILERAGKTLPVWATRRRTILRELLTEDGATVSEDPATSPFGLAVARGIMAGDVPAALAAAKEFCAERPQDLNAGRALQALERLWAVVIRTEDTLPAERLATVPMTVQQAAVLQLRMGNLELAERMCRRALLSEPLDGWSRDRLADLEVLRMAMEGSNLSVPPDAETISSAPAPAVSPPAGHFDDATRDTRSKRGAGSRALPKMTLRDHDVEALRAARKPPIEEEPTTRNVQSKTTVSTLLNKKSRPVAIQKNEYAPPEAQESVHAGPGSAAAIDEPTTVQGPQELHAELLLKQGFAVRALAVYEKLAQRFPEEPRHADRIREIRGFISERQTSLPEPRMASSSPPLADSRVARAPAASGEITVDVGGETEVGDLTRTVSRGPQDAQDSTVFVQRIIVVA